MLSVAKFVSIVGDWMSVEHAWSDTGKGELKYSEIPVSVPFCFTTDCWPGNGPQPPC